MKEGDNKMYDNIQYSRNIKYFILLFVSLGYMIYSPMTINYLTNPDGICIGLVYKPYSEGEELGRIGIKIIDILLGRIISPNLMLIISLFILGWAVYFLTEIFDVKSLINMLLLGIIALVMPTTSSTFSYYYCMVPYIMSYFMAVFASYITIKNTNKWVVIISGGIIALQLMLYQAYLSVTVVIALLYLVYMLYTEPMITKIKNMALRFILMDIIGVGTYLLSLKILNVPLSSNRGFNRMGYININTLSQLIRKSYIAFGDYFFGNRLLNNRWLYRNLFNGLVFALLLGIFVYLGIREKMYKQLYRVILGGGIIAILPIAFELMVIIAPDVDTFGTTGILLVPAMSFVYMSIIFFQPLIMKRFWGSPNYVNLMRYSYLIVICPLIWNLILFTAAYENVMWLNYQSTYALCGKISERIEECANKYQVNVKVMIAGNPEVGNYPCTYEELRNIVKGTLATKGLVWQGGWLSNVCYQAIFRNYFNINYQIPTADEYDKIIKSVNYELMGVFPDMDSVIIIDDVIVVKLDNEYK